MVFASHPSPPPVLHLYRLVWVSKFGLVLTTPPQTDQPTPHVCHAAVNLTLLLLPPPGPSGAASTALAWNLADRGCALFVGGASRDSLAGVSCNGAVQNRGEGTKRVGGGRTAVGWLWLVLWLVRLVRLTDGRAWAVMVRLIIGGREWGGGPGPRAEVRVCGCDELSCCWFGRCGIQGSVEMILGFKLRGVAAVAGGLEKRPRSSNAFF